MKRILVVSDNPVLLSYFIKKCSEPDIQSLATIEYCYSKVNKNPAEMIKLGARAIDMKDPAAIAYAKQLDLIFSIHCKQIFPEEIVSSVKCVNLHPGYNPYGRGWYPQVFSIIENTPAGATLHVMDAEIDNGPIIDRVEVPVFSSDTSLEVYNRVVDAEKELLAKNLLSIINGSHGEILPEQAGQCRSISDFRNLCELDLDSVGTLESHINLLRALSHGAFNNAYYVDSTGNKIFVRLLLTKVDNKN